MAYPTQKDMETALLNILHQAGGKMALKDIYQPIREVFSDTLTAEDINRKNKSGDNTLEEAFLFFSTGFVKCNKENYTLHPYKEMKG